MTIKKLFREEVGETTKPFEKLLKPLFSAWVKNKLEPVSFMLQKPEIRRPRKRIQDAIRTVHELCGHYCYDDDYDHYFFHLISILEKLPQVTKEECKRGFDDLKAIFKLFDIEWNIKGCEE